MTDLRNFDLVNGSSSYLVRENINGAKLFGSGRNILPSLDIELTERCNNNCIHCYINQPENDENLLKKELSTEKLKDIIKEAESLGCLTIRFTGGEPLLRPDFREIYLYTRRLGIKVLLFTNGTLMDTGLADLLKKYPPGEKIEITLYGTSEESYGEITGRRDNFHKVLNCINLMTERDIPFIIKGVYLPGYEYERKNLEEFADVIPFMDNKAPSFSMHFDLRARRDNERKNQLIKKIRISGDKTIEFLEKNRGDFIPVMKDFASKFMGPKGDRIFTCGCGNGGSVDSYGMFQPCLMMRHPDYIYDLKNGSLEYAVKEFSLKLKTIRSKNPEYLEKCAKCFLHGLCDQCPAKSWMENGEIDSPAEYYCEIAHSKAQLLGLVRPGEKAWTVENWQERMDNFIKK